MEIKTTLQRNDSILSMDDYCLDRLFDPEELYYTPMDELLKRYKKRNLRFLSSIYSFSCQFFLSFWSLIIEYNFRKRF